MKSVVIFITFCVANLIPQNENSPRNHTFLASIFGIKELVHAVYGPDFSQKFFRHGCFCSLLTVRF